MEDYITRREHMEFSARMDDANKQLGKRLDRAEAALEKIGDIAISVQRLASNMEHMFEEQKRQGTRLTAIEARDGDMWRKVVGYAATAIVGIIVGYIFKHLGF